jgi:hypothetical protein
MKISVMQLKERYRKSKERHQKLKEGAIWLQQYLDERGMHGLDFYTVLEAYRHLDSIGVFIYRSRFENADNYRVADTSIPSQVAAYEIQRNKGCCGSYDKEITYGTRKIMVGFNYGH